MTTPGDELLFLALGGSGEIGMNVNLYGTKGKWLMVDCGITFSDPSCPGVELILPDLAFIEERLDDLLGIVLTHGHEDHIGALPFTAGLIRGKLDEEGISDKIELNIIENEGSFTIGPFGITYVPLAHSIPEGNAVLIDTPYGRIFHTGDWKLDDAPQLGEPSTPEELTAIGDKGVLALVCDSTNVFNPEPSGSEGSVRAGSMRRLPAPRGGCLSPPLLPMPRGCRRWAVSPRIPDARCVWPDGRSIAFCAWPRASAISRISPKSSISIPRWGCRPAK